MAVVICPVCNTENANGETQCYSCGFPLDEQIGPAREAPAGTPGPAPEPATATCPACGATIPDSANLVCVDCLEPLAPRPSGASVARTRRAGTALRLLFPGKPVDVPQPGLVLLGRDPDQSPVANLFTAHDNVSRKHASVGVEPDGTAWVRDEGSTNGTFVNNKPVLGGHTAPLTHGDQLRFASDVVARVELGHTGRPA